MTLTIDLSGYMRARATSHEEVQAMLKKHFDVDATEKSEFWEKIIEQCARAIEQGEFVWTGCVGSDNGGQEAMVYEQGLVGLGQGIHEIMGVR